MASPPAAASAPVVSFTYDELAGAPTAATCAKVGEAFGHGGLGLCVVTGTPGYAELRAALLPYAFKFGTLPSAVKERYEHAASLYSFGWSHGREHFAGAPDMAKGSFYFNPVHDSPCDDAALLARPELLPFLHPNIWPAPGDCDGLEAAAKALGRRIVGVGELLAAHVDAYVASATAAGDAAPTRTLAAVVRDTRTHKARLLYYFPSGAAPAGDIAAPAASSAVLPTAAPTAAPGDTPSWCGYHNDHGSLTGLTSAMYFDEAGRETECPDAAAGLHVHARTGETVRVAIPRDALAFQIGETAQVHSGGALHATPHYVRAPRGAPGMSRGTLAVFMEPEHDVLVDAPLGVSRDELLKRASGVLPHGVPELGRRWTGNAQSFADFTGATLALYY